MTEPNPPGRPARTGVVAVLVTVAAFGVGGYAAAWVWPRLSDVPSYQVTDQGAFLDEVQLQRQFDADGWFLVIGLVGGLALSLVLAAVFRRHGILTLLSVLAGSAVAAFVCYHVGPQYGPGPLDPRLAAAQPGDLVPAPIRVRATGVLFGWPIGALVGALVAQSLLWRVDDPTASAALGSGRSRDTAGDGRKVG